MPPSDKTTYDDSVLVNYIVGSLPETDAERLDELSVSDRELADRLEAIENDLVDSWARGELSGELLEQVNRVYRASPQRIGKLRFAQALVAHQKRAATTKGVVDSSVATTSTLRPEDPSIKRIRPFPSRRWFPQWAFAAIAALAVAGLTYLAIDNSRLRRELLREMAKRDAMEATQQQLSRQLATQSAPSPAKNDSERISASLTQLANQPKLVTALLLPPMRGNSQLANVLVPSKTTRVVLRLQLEVDDFPAYRAVLMESSSNKIVWHSQTLKAESDMGRPIISAGLPANLLKSQNYFIQLSGVRRQQAEVIGIYPFKAIVD